MNYEMKRLRLEQIEAATEAYAALTKRSAPPRGWLKVIRESLGLTERQQANRLGISAPTLHKCEHAEAEERISLRQLRKLADGLECELVYALVPRTSLSKTVEERARIVAMQEVSGVAQTMTLEGQRPATERLRKQVEQRAQELLRGRWSDLWR
jgi:predicted DNA-binding mobile mystery protein A